MDDHAKFERLLSILLLLCSGRNYTIREITESFNISERTVHRYISTFKNAGLIVEVHNGYYSIRRVGKKIQELSDLLHFSEEEAMILNKAIMAIDDDNVMKANLIQKLYAIYDFDRVSDAIVKPDQSQKIHLLYEAIKNRKQVLLRAYRSAHGKIVRDRMVELFDFTTNYQMIWAFEIESRKNKQFKVARMTEVQEIDNLWQFESEHKKMPMDPFRISGEKVIPVSIYMNLRAYSLMIEEYPLSESYIQKISDTKYLYEGPVCGFEGIGRFCLGLCDEIRIQSPASLQIYMDKKIRNFLKEKKEMPEVGM